MLLLGLNSFEIYSQTSAAMIGATAVDKRTKSASLASPGLGSATDFSSTQGCVLVETNSRTMLSTDSSFSWIAVWLDASTLLILFHSINESSLGT